MVRPSAYCSSSFDKLIPQGRRWYDPRYIINELNTNSAIAKPDHHETLELVSDEEEYVVKGYAYAGGGRRVNRVELSLDEGATWELAEIF
jgi:nitrate reductase (NAD(P)H)